jgi:hypothetical protein
VEEEAITQLQAMCCISYGSGALSGDARAASNALFRMLEDGGFQLRQLASLVAAAQTHAKLTAGLFARVHAVLRRPGVQAGVRAQLAAAQAGAPPERRLTYGQLELLVATTATLRAPDSPAARRCGANRGCQVLLA